MHAVAALRNALLVVDLDAATFEVTLTDHDLECLAWADGTLFCGTYDAGLLRSDDGGHTFDHAGVDGAVMSVAVNPTDPSEVWVGTEPSTVFHSTDGGATWAERSGLTDLPSAETWYFPPRPDTHHVRWLEQDPHEADTLYVGIEAGAFVRSEDRGRTWTERPPGSRRDNHSLATHPDAPGRVYAAAGDGYAESTDYGASWDHPQEGLAHRYCWSVRPDPGDPETVLVSSATSARQAHSPGTAETYVYRRTGDGAWERAMDGLPGPEGLMRAVLATDGTAGRFYALTNRGLFVTDDAGTRWTDVGLDWPDRFGRQTPRGLVID